MLLVNFIPFPNLETKRCILRQVVSADAPQILVLRSDKQVLKYLDKEPMYTLEEVVSFISKMDETVVQGSGISWGIILKESRQLIGVAGLWRLIKEHYRAEVGYTLLPDFWGKGIMSEVLDTIIDYGFTKIGLHSIEANVNPENQASIRLLEKHGFAREAYFRENYYFNGNFLDSAIYSLIKPKA